MQIIYQINFIVIFMIFLSSIYSLVVSNNLLKKLISLGIMQTSVILFFIAIARVYDGDIPFIRCEFDELCDDLYNNPIPHILMLTAIVVGVTYFIVGLFMISAVNKEFSSLDDNAINASLEDE